ncbi:MAG: ferredoxin--NADP reductase [bacterium]
MPINFRPASYGSTQRDAFAEDALGRGLPLNATIVERENLNEGLARIVVQLDGWQVKLFEPGQYADLALQPRKLERQAVPLSSLPIAFEQTRRSYSIASTPQHLDHLEFLFNLVPAGSFTPTLWRLDQGDRLHVDPRVRGRFTLREIPEGANVLMIATGTGVAPFISIARHYAGSGRWNRAALLHVVRHERDFSYAKELDALTRKDPSFMAIRSVTRPDEDEKGWKGLTGRPQALLADGSLEQAAGFPLDPEDGAQVMLCGNPGMIQVMLSLLQDHGFTLRAENHAGTLHTESYW